MYKVITNFNKIHHDKPVKIIISDLSKDEMKKIMVSNCRNSVITNEDNAIMVKNGRWYKIKTEIL